jgi:hypothetical protein
VRDIDPDPLSAELLRSMNGRSAAAERVKHHVTGIA